jgi:hypothetical protein
MTRRDVARLFFAASGRGANVARIPRILVAAMELFIPVLREVGEVLYDVR